MEACCEPFFNEWPVEQRGGRPRVYFEGNSLDNDATQALLSLLNDQRWSIVVISKSGGTLETAVALRVFLEALQERHPDEQASRLIPITGQGGKLDELSRQLGCESIFRVPEGVGGRFVSCPQLAYCQRQYGS